MTEAHQGRIVARVKVDNVCCEKGVVNLSGLGLTPGHPVILPGETEWKHPFEVSVHTTHLAI